MRDRHPIMSFFAKMKGEHCAINEMLTLLDDCGGASIAGERLDVQGEAPVFFARPGWSFGLHLGQKTPAGGSGVSLNAAIVFPVLSVVTGKVGFNPPAPIKSLPHPAP